MGYHLRFSRFAHWLINSFSVSQESKQQILQPLSVLRPKFRVNAAFVMYSHLIINITTLPGRCPIFARPREHGFRILNALANNTNRIWCSSKKLSKECCWITTVCSLRMGVPACLWRRTGEIYKGNREFTELVGVDGYMMRDVSDG